MQLAGLLQKSLVPPRPTPTSLRNGLDPTIIEGSQEIIEKDSHLDFLRSCGSNLQLLRPPNGGFPVAG